MKMYKEWYLINAILFNSIKLQENVETFFGYKSTRYKKQDLLKNGTKTNWA